MMPAAGSLICGAALLTPVSALVDRPWTLAPSAHSVAALLALSVFSTALAFVIYFRLVQTLGSVSTTAQAYLRVPIGVLIGVVFLGERLSATAWVGLICIVVGVAAMTVPPAQDHRWRQRSRPAPSSNKKARRLAGPLMVRSGRARHACHFICFARNSWVRLQARSAASLR